MPSSRREFLSAAGAMTAAAIASTRAKASAPYNVLVQRASGSGSGDAIVATQGSDVGTAAVPVSIPSTMPMGSGAPLGGIGTGFVEIRPDGCFYEWQILNSGAWSQNAKSTTATPGRLLRFMVRTHRASNPTPQIRKLYLRSDENDNYTLPYVQDVSAINYSAMFPITALDYTDASIPVQISSTLFSPFYPGSARDSGTPGFHVVFSLTNASKEPVDVSLTGFLENPIASAMHSTDRHLTNSIAKDGPTTTLNFNCDAKSDFPSGIGSMALSVTGGEHTFITGTFQPFCPPGSLQWSTPRTNYMLVNVLDEYWEKGKLPNSSIGQDPSLTLPKMAAIDAMSAGEVIKLLESLSADALLARVIYDARESDPADFEANAKSLLKEIRQNLVASDKDNTPKHSWGTGALASSITLAPGEKKELRFTLSWFFPHHLTTHGREMGHMYANWFNSAAEVNQFLNDNYDRHRAVTHAFARTLADTTLGDAMAFSWSCQLSTAVFNTWWTKDNAYAMWEGLGCCGLSTTDVDYQGSFPIVAMFPELKLAQMRRIITHMNDKGQVPHNYPGDVDAVDSKGFERVDMNHQFVMMVCRDYLWTADKDYLNFMYPYIQRAMAFGESLDTNGDALPDKDTGLQTYDQWRMRGTPAYIASLWIGALQSAIRLANDAGKSDDAKRWQILLDNASASFDKLLFNGEYFSLWVDGDTRDELCMTDQISGEWFTHLMGLDSTLDPAHLQKAVGSIFKNNFNAEFGVHNATAPKRGLGLLAVTNLQAGGLWSGIEYAFAAFLIDHGRYDDGIKVIDAIHRRYLRAGQLWNHVECGGHYSRAMSSWTTLLAATGFKPDLPNKTIAVIPVVAGDFRAPWVTASGFGTISRAGRAISIECVHGSFKFENLKVASATRVRLGETKLSFTPKADGQNTLLQFAKSIVIDPANILTIEF